MVAAFEGPDPGQAIIDYAADCGRARAAGLAGRVEVERRFSLKAMVDAYQGLYDRLLSPAN